MFNFNVQFELNDDDDDAVMCPCRMRYAEGNRWCHLIDMGQVVETQLSMLRCTLTTFLNLFSLHFHMAYVAVRYSIQFRAGNQITSTKRVNAKN